MHILLYERIYFQTKPSSTSKPKTKPSSTSKPTAKQKDMLVLKTQHEEHMEVTPENNIKSKSYDLT